jgi:hypothetical protein
MCILFFLDCVREIIKSYFNLRNLQELRTTEETNFARRLTKSRNSACVPDNDQPVNCVEPMALNLAGSLSCLICKSLSEFGR